MRVLVAPDSMGGLLSAHRLAAAVATGWRAERPGDEVRELPLSDGGEGLLDVVHRSQDTRVDVEVAGPLGHPVPAWLSLRADGTAIVESALACGLAHLRPDQRDPLRATTFGVGQLLDAARGAGARRVLVGLGGSATVDGGAGALTGLGFRLRVADGSGLKVGAADLHRVTTIERGWADPGWQDVEVDVLADVQTVLGDAARVFGPQKGATPPVVDQLEAALVHWRQVVAHELGAEDLGDRPGTGAAGGLGFALAAALHARLLPGAPTVADLLGLDTHVRWADVVVTGEGRVDATSRQGKVVGDVLDRATAAGCSAAVVAGAAEDGVDLTGVADLETAPAADPAEAEREAEAAARRLAARFPDV